MTCPCGDCLLAAIQGALNTEETGEDLIDVARAAHAAEQELAAIQRLIQTDPHSVQVRVGICCGCDAFPALLFRIDRAVFRWRCLACLGAPDRASTTPPPAPEISPQ